MKHAGAVKWLMGGVFVVVIGATGCPRGDNQSGIVADRQPSSADRSAEPAGPTVDAPAPAVSAVDSTGSKRSGSPGPRAGTPSDRPNPRAEQSGAAVKTDGQVGEPGVSLDGEADSPPRAAIVPLVDHYDQLQPLHPTMPAWFDKAQRQVVLVGEICQNRVPLELFACQRGSKEHESIISVQTEARLVHAGLVAAGAEPGNPVRYQPTFVPAAGTEIDVTVVWKDEQGQRHEARGQDWIRHMQTGKPMDYPWVFAGSRMSVDAQTGRQLYQADWEGDLICVSNFPSAVLDVPVQSSDANNALLFETFTERIPPIGTPVTLLLRPKLKGPPNSAK